MRILIADDEAVSRLLLESTLNEAGYNVITTSSGNEALHALNTDDPPPIAIIDWLMPDLDGIELIRQMRQTESGRSIYTILLTGKTLKEGLVNAFDAGADDYLLKPFDPDELHARLKAGKRILTLQTDLNQKISDLQSAALNIRQLEELLPMCSYCRNVRSENDSNYWSKLEDYVTQRTDTKISHSICPNCYETEVQPQLDRMRNQKTAATEYRELEPGTELLAPSLTV